MKHMLIMAAAMAIAFTANAMSYESARDEALFLSDKMAYELDLTDEQYEAVYEINLDYYFCLARPDDLFGPWWDRRNADLRLVLSDWQYEKFLAIEYFYRPARWEADAWVFVVYSHYAHDLFYFTHPKVFNTYRGGNNRMAADFYASRIAQKPVDAMHVTPPAANPAAPAAKPDAPAKVNNPAPRVDRQPSTPNNDIRPSAPAGRPGGQMGGRPAGGPGGGPRGRR